jgi:hypothetical protein
MRRVLLSFTAASIILSVAALTPTSAMTVGTASGISAGLAATSTIDEVVYVCRHRYFTSRRLCWWRPGGYSWRPWRRSGRS